jgi:hypothetical protein
MNKIKVLFFLTIALCFADSSFGQIKLNVDAAVSNVLRYGNGYEYFLNSKYGKEYFEDLADARLNVNGVIFGLRYDISDPREYGRDTVGIDKRYIEYKHDIGISLRAGDFYEIIGRGLSLNTFEDRQQAFDTGIDGARVIFQRAFGKKNPMKMKLQALGGDISYVNYLDLDREEKYKIRSAYGEFSPLKFLTFGLNYVYSVAEMPEQSENTVVKTDIPEFGLFFNLPDVQVYASYAHKSSRVSPNSVYPNAFTGLGDGFYTSVSYTKGDVGITFDYKNYAFDITLPDNRSPVRPTRALPYQNPPTVQREHTSTLISRYPHVVDFNDEVGAQVDVVYAPTGDITLNFNGALASRHYQYQDIDTGSSSIFQRIDRSDSYIPNLDDQFSPFWELFVEGEYYITPHIYTKLAFDRQSNTLFNQLNPQSSEKVMTSTIPFEFKYTFGDINALKLIFEMQWVNNSIRLDDKTFTNELISLNYSMSPYISATLGFEFTNDKEEPTGKDKWYIGEVTYRINESNTVTASYGSERGGLRCTNGICRFVQPFQGFRLGIATQF